MAETSGTVDQDLYSRQIGTYGMETMGKLVKMKVLFLPILLLMNQRN